ncbi:MAG: hypothetical protein RSA54_05160 [Glutamicibacter sp.]
MARHAVAGNGNNLPEWTNQFLTVSGNEASFDTFNGVVDVTFEVHASEQHGTIDTKLVFPSGQSGWAYSRLSRNVEGVIYGFTFILPPMPESDLLIAYATQKANIEDELSKLKSILSA